MDSSDLNGTDAVTKMQSELVKIREQISREIGNIVDHKAATAMAFFNLNNKLQASEDNLQGIRKKVVELEKHAEELEMQTLHTRAFDTLQRSYTTLSATLQSCAASSAAAEQMAREVLAAVQAGTALVQLEAAAAREEAATAKKKLAVAQNKAARRARSANTCRKKVRSTIGELKLELKALAERNELGGLLKEPGAEAAALQAAPPLPLSPATPRTCKRLRAEQQAAQEEAEAQSRERALQLFQERPPRRAPQGAVVISNNN